MRPPSQFSQDFAAEAEEQDPRMGAMMICTRLAGRAIIRVVGRCNDAIENNNLDLSNCQLMRVPDAVYHLMRHTELKSCDLSQNDITKITPKFTANFSLITNLNLSRNQMAKLPDEIADMANLERLDISFNTFVSLPDALFKIAKLKLLNASNNHIVDVDSEDIEDAPSLVTLDLTRNPVTARCHDRLNRITKIEILLTEREKEDWEDLTI